ncbi:hypothetical protein PENFLA_c040G10459 [Penicillium flavigenum]|uniref:Uncharacterized protein n=1 Tax=Penicillium flavigenum TaxID=254877 RepID=A0A1V6SJF9_9EURO|nr:hypothetical protein PENFLA_c040G10459 [Penicillium flavigenum]
MPLNSRALACPLVPTPASGALPATVLRPRPRGPAGELSKRQKKRMKMKRMERKQADRDAAAIKANPEAAIAKLTAEAKPLGSLEQEEEEGIAPTPDPFMLLPETSMESDSESVTLPISFRSKGKGVARRSASASGSHPHGRTDDHTDRGSNQDSEEVSKEGSSYIPFFIHQANAKSRAAFWLID